MEIYHHECVILLHIQNFAPRTSHIPDLQPISRDTCIKQCFSPTLTACRIDHGDLFKAYVYQAVKI